VVTTDQYGYAYFPTALPQLVAGTYAIDVTMANFHDGSDTVSINGTLQKKTITLIPD
jgi:hypothetical protein